MVPFITGQMKFSTYSLFILRVLLWLYVSISHAFIMPWSDTEHLHIKLNERETQIMES